VGVLNACINCRTDAVDPFSSDFNHLRVSTLSYGVPVVRVLSVRV
jgi:hypothetical protein